MFCNKDLLEFIKTSILGNKSHNETIEHMYRCSVIAEEFGNFIGLPKDEIKILKISALLHDMGKFFVEPSILYKEGKLTETEFNHIKKHTDILYGYDDFCFDETGIIKEVMTFHHERYDGKGYHNISTKELSKFVKIMVIIDCYDVMSNKRCYKNYICDMNSIKLELINNIGTQFDDKYTMLFINYLNWKNNKSYLNNFCMEG